MVLYRSIETRKRLSKGIKEYHARGKVKQSAEEKLVKRREYLKTYISPTPRKKVFPRKQCPKCPTLIHEQAKMCRPCRIKEPRSKEWLKNMSLAQKGKRMGKETPGWKGGISKNPYPSEFDRLLRREIRDRDDNRCNICYMPQENFKRLLDVHHIDYDKKNNSTNNLISLCVYCHVKTNWNRDYYKNHFQRRMYARGLQKHFDTCNSNP